MLKDFVLYIKEKQLFNPSERLLLTISGGIDSVVLAELCHQAGLLFGIAHCNFQLRGEESEGDEAFVRKLAQKYNVAFHTQRFETKAFSQQNGLSTQMAARELRYKWFEKIRQEYNYNYILTAHHQDDLLETVLLNLTRGTGLAGLHGILPKNGFLVRPLLFATRDRITHFLQQMQLTWREDSSNQTNDYLRNRLRHEVIPILQGMNPKVAVAVSELAERVRATEEIVAESMLLAAKEVIFEENDSTWISYDKLKQHSAPLERLSHWLAKYDFTYYQTKVIWESRNGQAGKQFFSTTHTLIADRNHWIITPTKREQLHEFRLESEEGEINYPNGLLKWEVINAVENVIAETNLNEIFLDADALSFPLALRLWQKGDWFCPLGMKGKRKKISDFLIDNKVPRNLKEKVYILETEGKIAWVVSFRPDDRFKVNEKTKKYIKFSNNTNI
jgi:tRNA(Ile)-lysidine synthase